MPISSCSLSLAQPMSLFWMSQCSCQTPASSPPICTESLRTPGSIWPMIVATPSATNCLLHIVKLSGSEKICSDNAVAAMRCRELKFDLVKRGYPRKIVANKINKALRLNRDDLLTHRANTSETDVETVAWVCTYHPALEGVPQILERHWHFLAEKGKKLKIYWRAPVKLRQKLCSSALQPLQTQQKSIRGGV